MGLRLAFVPLLLTACAAGPTAPEVGLLLPAPTLELRAEALVLANPTEVVWTYEAWRGGPVLLVDGSAGPRRLAGDGWHLARLAPGEQLRLEPPADRADARIGIVLHQADQARVYVAWSRGPGE